MTGARPLVPSARRLMSSLRDIGYDTPAAAADLVDNSIDAGATEVTVDVTYEGADSWVRVADNGGGMTERGLEAAMRYGSQRTYGDGDLGRFGLGLKTASLSQCRCLTVATRTTPKARIAIRSWDLDHVTEVDRWDLLRFTPSDLPAWVCDPIRKSRGTVIAWEGLDRIEAFSNPDGRWAEAALERETGRIKAHLSAVFHRLLVGKSRRQGLRITVCGDELQPWDPFAQSEPATISLQPQVIREQDRDGSRVVRVSPFILPTQREFSSPEAHEAASGINRWNRQQGFYVYRGDRLIQSGGWNRLRTLDEHSKLARIAVDIPSGGEDAWKLNVSKMTVSIPASIRPALKTIAAETVRRAQTAYRPLPAETKPRSSAGAGAAREWRLGEQWDEITRVLEGELRSDPARLDRILRGLINSAVLNRDVA